jgi:hypothetical protein
MTSLLRRGKKVRAQIHLFHLYKGSLEGESRHFAFWWFVAKKNDHLEHFFSLRKNPEHL